LRYIHYRHRYRSKTRKHLWKIILDVHVHRLPLEVPPVANIEMSVIDEAQMLVQSILENACGKPARQIFFYFPHNQLFGGYKAFVAPEILIASVSIFQQSKEELNILQGLVFK